MRIFWKHIFRSIKRAPLQSVFIVLTLIIATASVVISAKSFFRIRENLEAKEGVDNYVSDITVALSSKSELRLMLDGDLKELVGDSGTVLGEFSLEGLCVNDNEREFVKFSAVDLREADAFYKFKFTDYGKFTNQNYKKAIIVSTAFAEKYGLSVGDSFSLLLLNQSFDFTVEAIAIDDGILRECGGVFSIDAVRDLLAKSNPVINSFSDGFTPYSQLRVRVKDASEIDSVLQRISEDERFSDKRVFKNSEEFRRFDFYTTVSLLVMSVTSALVIVVSALVVSSSMDLIRKKRRGEVALFALCGAERRHLNTMVYLEGALYSLLGLAGGVPLARVLYKYVNNSLRMSGNGLEKGKIDWLYALLASFAVMAFSTFIHLSRERKKTSYQLIGESETEQRGEGALGAAITASVLLAVALCFTLALPTVSRMIPALATMFVFLLWCFVITPQLFKLISQGAVYAFASFKRTPTLAFMSFKNVFSSYPLRHTGRLITLLLVILSTILFSIASVDDQIDMYENVFDCDYVAVGADEGCDGMIAADERVDSCFRVNLVDDVVTEHGTGVICISAAEDALTHLSPELDITELPASDGAFISCGISKLCGAGVGDKISLYIGGEEYIFTVARVLDTKSNFAFIDAEHIGLGNDKLAIIMRGGYSNEEHISALSSILHPRGAGFVEFDSITTENSEFTKSVLGYMEFIVLIAIVTTLIGVVNLIISAHGARASEFAVLYLSGCTRGRILLLEVCEVLTVTILAVLLAIPGGYAFSSILDLSLNSFGADFLH